MKYLIIIFLLTSCGPTAKLRRADRLIKKALAMGATIKADTLYKTVHDTIPGTNGYSSEYEIGPTSIDTIFVNNVRVIVKHDTIKSKHYEKIFVKTPPIVKTIKVPYQVIKTINAPINNSWRNAAFIQAGLLLLLITGMILYFYATRKR